MQLAERIRKIREAKKLTQEEVAFRCDISPSAYGQIERRASTSSYETLSKVASAIGVPILFLLDIGNPEYSEQKSE